MHGDTPALSALDGMTNDARRALKRGLTLWRGFHSSPLVFVYPHSALA